MKILVISTVFSVHTLLENSDTCFLITKDGKEGQTQTPSTKRSLNRASLAHLCESAPPPLKDVWFK